jgi:hypothetical protein
MSALDTAKDVVEIIRKIDNIELYKKILDLHGEIVKVYEENTTLKQKVQSLQDTLRTKNALEYNQNCYWLQTDQGKDGPFCVHCWDTEQKLVRLHQGQAHWWCLTHRQQFRISVP